MGKVKVISPSSREDPRHPGSIIEVPSLFRFGTPEIISKRNDDNLTLGAENLASQAAKKAKNLQAEIFKAQTF